MGCSSHALQFITVSGVGWRAVSVDAFSPPPPKPGVRLTPFAFASRLSRFPLPSAVSLLFTDRIPEGSWQMGSGEDCSEGLLSGQGASQQSPGTELPTNYLGGIRRTEGHLASSSLC